VDLLRDVFILGIHGEDDAFGRLVEYLQHFYRRLGQKEGQHFLGTGQQVVIDDEAFFVVWNKTGAVNCGLQLQLTKTTAANLIR